MSVLPAFAGIADLEARMPSGVGDRRRAQAALDDASALIRAEAGKTWITEGELDDDRPGILKTVCCAAARRSITNPDGVESETTGPFSRDLADASGDVYLKASEKALVRQAAGSSNVTTISTTREDPTNASDFGTLAADGTIYVDTDDGAPIPFIDDGYFAT